MKRTKQLLFGSDNFQINVGNVYLLIICTVLSLLILLVGLFYAKGNRSMMLLLCCTILLVLGSKMVEGLLD